MRKPITTKTTGPLHFEDLEPKRFEDLVRSLIIKFKDWYKIEPTGRGGSDDGFDIRAWEKNRISAIASEYSSPSEDEDVNLDIEGNKWKIQCKREKNIGPSKLHQHLEDSLKKDEDIYGYIFAAPVDFSKKSMDKFREDMHLHGVKEFFLWGKATLEDMLYLPENDNILFTFFGTSMQRTRINNTAKMRYKVTIKNRLFAILKLNQYGQNSSNGPEVVVLDISSSNYPQPDPTKFSLLEGKNWAIYTVLALYPKGILLCMRKSLAYVNHKNKTYDYIAESDLRNLQQRHNTSAFVIPREDTYYHDYWARIPFPNRETIIQYCLIPYDEILVLDGKGNQIIPIPHIFIDFQKSKESLNNFRISTDKNNDYGKDLTHYKKIKYFPEKYNEIKYGKIYQDEEIQFLNNVHLNGTPHNEQGMFAYMKKDSLRDLKINDVITLPPENTGSSSYSISYEIIDIQEISTLSSIKNEFLRKNLKESGKVDDKNIKVFELRQVYLRTN